MTPPVFVISLPKDSDRYKALESSLVELGLSPSRIIGFNGRAGAERLKRIWRRPFRRSGPGAPPMSGGEIGCFASHIKILRRIVKRAMPVAIILEDDAHVGPRFGEFVRRDFDRFMKRVDILKLQGTPFPHTSEGGLTVVRDDGFRAVVPLRPHLGSVAYAVTLHGARALLEVAETMDEPYDVVLGAYERHGATFAELRPLLVTQSDDAVSNIGSERSVPAAPERSLSSQRIYLQKVAVRLAKIGSAWLSSKGRHP